MSHTTHPQTAPAKLAALAVPVPHLDGPRAVLDSSVWIRLPRVGARCPVSGLSRSSLAELVRPGPRCDYAPPVASRLLKRRGAARGILLISKQSLLEYINAAPAPTRADVNEDDTKGGDERRPPTRPRQQACNPAGSTSQKAATPGTHPSQESPTPTAGETVILTDPSGNSEAVDLLRFVDAHRRMESYRADLAAGRTDDLAPFYQFMSLKREFSRFFGGANILNPEVSHAANPLLKTKSILMLRCVVLALVLREAAVECGIQINEEIADRLKGGQAHG